MIESTAPRSSEFLPTAQAAGIAFTAHSIPQAMAAGSQYEVQLREASPTRGPRRRARAWDLVFQSRSAAPSQPWLEPDIRDWLRQQHAAGVRDVVVVPIGFVSDHLEVIYDLDMEAQRLCGELGMHMVRAATVGTHARFVRMIRELIVERMTPGAPRPGARHTRPLPRHLPRRLLLVRGASA